MNKHHTTKPDKKYTVAQGRAMCLMAVAAQSHYETDEISKHITETLLAQIRKGNG